MNRMREIRKEKKLTMKQLGKMVGVSESTISLYENGKHDPDLATLQRIASALEVSVDTLLGLNTEPTITPYEPTDSELMRIPSIAMMAREMGQMTEAQRQQMLDVGRTLMRTFFNVETEE